ncbi:MAG TPA: hypothetical protein VK508_01675 [Cyclobacteriaceae bacterium]|nr:hypothetical protein [Cyclobacteriaceae bacterium]
MREIPLYPPVSEVRLELSYRDSLGVTIKSFNNVNELAEFLKSNPPLAKELSYVPKKSKPPSPDPNEKVKETMKLFMRANILSALYADAGVIMCAQKLLIEKIKTGWVLTVKGKEYIEKLRSEQ